MSHIQTDSMTIDTSPAAIAALTQCLQTLGRDMDRHAAPEWDEHENVFLAVNTIDALAAERDAQTARADAAEAREQALLSTYDAERKVMVENVAIKAEVARLTAELTALRAGQDALEAKLRAERNKALRDAAAVKKTDKFGDDWLGMSCAILAMIEPEGE